MQDSIECQYIICCVVPSYDKLVIIYCVLSLIYTDYIPSGIYIYIHASFLKSHFGDINLKRAWAFLYKAKWFQVLLYNSHSLTSVICLHTFK